ncbi:MAG TPA: gamma-glutamyltransferase [Longimicrobiales bacterium]
MDLSTRRFPLLALAVFVAACGAAPPDARTDADAVRARPATNRPDVMGMQGAVSSDHPLATAAGYEVLRRGGNAVDAAVTMAAVLAVVRPHMNGVGGDAFALIYDGETGDVSVLNGSGRAGALATAEFIRAAGHERMPSRGALTVTVPGAVQAWADALERHGTISLAEALAPAIRYARGGWPVTSRLHSDIAGAGRRLNDAGRAIFMPGGAAPAVGSILRNPALAETLEAIARGGADAFYRGPIAERLATFVEAEGGALRAGDFAAHTSTWTEPLRTDYHGYEILAVPPNSQGIAQLIQLRMAAELDLAAMGHNTAEYLHTLVEIKKLAFADRDRWVADPAFYDPPIERLLAPEYARERLRLIGERALDADSVASGIPAAGDVASGSDAADDGDTVYLTAVDRWGNAVSWIQSLFSSFGSGLVEPTTGIVLQNRGAGFRLDPSHPNGIAPGKRPFHTLTPLLVLRDGRLAFTLGTPGGHGQTQTLLQVLNNVLLFGMTPQEAVEAPRYRSENGRELLLEQWFDGDVVAALEARGHEVRIIPGWVATFGGSQMIRVDPASGARIAAADPRREAYAIAY